MDAQPNLNALVKKLVTTGHLNVPERALLAGKAPASAIIAAIEDVLRAARFFPPDWRPEQEFDGGLIERRDMGVCRITWKAEVSVLRFELVEVQEFGSARQAAEAYARRSYNDNIDGVPIDWNA